MCKVIAICNQKGGVSKTTTTVNLGVGLVREGKKVLVIDADPQGNLSQSLGIENPDELDIALPSIMEQIIMDKDVDVTKGIIHHEEGLDLMPCNIDLSGVDVSLVNAMSREFVLKTYVESMREFYDYILIDCMPSLGMITVNSLTASDSVLVPVQAAYLPVKGLEQLITTIYRVKKHLNPQIQFEGILISMLNARTNYAKDIMELIKKYYGESIPIFESKIPFSVKAAETSAAGVSIFTLDKKLSGHTRKHVCEVLGLETMPVFVKEMDNDEASVVMVDSNIQRENIRPSEKAKAYKIKYDAMKNQGKTGNSLKMMSEESGENYKMIQRYIWLARLNDALLDLVDNKQLGLVQGVSLSVLSEEEQGMVYDAAAYG